MRQQSVRAEASVENRGGLNDRWPVWMNAVLCSFFLHRRSKLYSSSGGDACPSPSSSHRFAQSGLRRVASMRESSGHPARIAVEERSNWNATSSASLSASKSKPDFLWGIPWFYLAFLLLAWLLLL